MNDLVDENELEFRYSTSSGPGGQHVNRTETRVTLLFDVAASRSLNDMQKEIVARRLARRINRDGLLHVTVQRHRSQDANRREAVERFHELIAAALKPKKKRHRTKTSRAQKRRRLESKKRRADLKRSRSSRSWGD